MYTRYIQYIKYTKYMKYINYTKYELWNFDIYIFFNWIQCDVCAICAICGRRETKSMQQTAASAMLWLFRKEFVIRQLVQHALHRAQHELDIRMTLTAGMKVMKDMCDTKEMVIFMFH